MSGSVCVSDDGSLGGWLAGWMIVSNQTREGWTLLTVKTEANGNSKRTNEKGPSLIGSLSWRAGTIDFCSALAALVGPGQNMFFLTVHYFILISLSPSPCKLGRQSCGVACLLVCVSVPDSRASLLCVQFN